MSTGEWGIGPARVSIERWESDLADRASLVSAAASHVGLVRELNEDAFLVGPPLYVVADGMGGHARGDVASQLVIDSFRPLRGKADTSLDDLRGAIQDSRERIAELGIKGGPGSTVVAAAFTLQSGLGYWLIAHEGDSRAYTWTPGHLTQVTRDHSVVQEMLDSGQLAAEDAHDHPDRHVITRAVGAQIDSEPDFTLVPAESGSRLLLCSDGLSGEVDGQTMADLLDGCATGEDATRALVAAALHTGGRDNVTVLVVDVIGVPDQLDDTLGGGLSETPPQTPDDTLPGRVSV